MSQSSNTHLESSLEQFFRKRVTLLGGRCIKMMPTEAGIPDRMVVFPSNRVFLVELKAEGGRLSPIQIVRHRQLRDYGMRVHVLYGPEGCLDWLRQVVSADDPKDRRLRDSGVG